MSAFITQLRLGLTLAIRNRMALIYGFIFPLIFLVAFWVLYRHDEVPIALHLGELLTVTILGGACFGLPTTLVNERERGVWRRYRLTPTAPWLFIAGTLTTRFILILAAALLQIALACALGMPAPAHPFGLLLAFVMTVLAFMGLGLIIAVLSDNVPTVQALGQCIFLPMLIIGGVAVRLTALPEWALYVSAFFPGRYAVSALQSNTTGAGLSGVGFELLALGLIGAAALVAGLRLFRWDTARSNSQGNRLWLLSALSAWVLVGVLAVWQGRVDARQPVLENVGDNRDFAAVSSQPSWQQVASEEFQRVAFERLPPDNGLIAPVAAVAEQPEALIAEQVADIAAALATWPPAQVAEPVQRTRNYLYVLAVVDLLQMTDVERFLPQAVFAQLQRELNKDDLSRILYWIAMHPDAGDDAALAAMQQLGISSVPESRQALRGRVMLYAFKFLGRLTGDIPL